MRKGIYWILMVTVCTAAWRVEAASRAVLGRKATVFIFVASHCPCADPHRRLVQRLVDAHRSQHVNFYAIFANRDETPELAARFMRQTEWDFPWIIDTNGEYLRRFDARITPETIVVNARKDIVYRGAIDDSVPNLGRVTKPYLQTALHQLLDGQSVEPQFMQPYGCYIVR